MGGALKAFCHYDLSLHGGIDGYFKMGKSSPTQTGGSIILETLG